MVEKEQFRSTGLPKRIVASVLVAGAVVSTGTGISTQEVAQSDLSAPLRNLSSWNDRTTNGLFTVFSKTIEDRQATETSIPSTANFSEVVKSLRQESGLTWDQLGRLFGVSRRAMHLWASSGRMNAAHAEALSAIPQVVRNLPESGSIDPREALLRPGADGHSLYDQLRDRFAPDEDAPDSSILT